MPFPMSNNLPKNERLHHKKAIEGLFADGSFFFAYPFKLQFSIRKAPTESEKIRILISIPKRNFKKAVQRNLLKRRIKEAYRLNKSAFLEKLQHSFPNQSIDLAFVYTQKQVLAYAIIEEQVVKALNMLVGRIGGK